jgi:AcrR family transcriptional regulator
MERGDTTRARIIEIAAQAFAAGGYHGASYRELIAKSGLSKGAFYHHFRSKEELALAVVKRKQEQVTERWAESGARAGRMPDRLFTVMRDRARLFVADRTLQCLPRLTGDFARDPALARHVAGMHAPAIESIAAMIRQGQHAGEVSRIDADAAARAIFAALVGIGEVSERESGGADHLVRTEELIALLDAALRPATTSPRPRRDSRESKSQKRKGTS